MNGSIWAKESCLFVVPTSLQVVALLKHPAEQHSLSLSLHGFFIGLSVDVCSVPPKLVIWGWDTSICGLDFMQGFPLYNDPNRLRNPYMSARSSLLPRSNYSLQ